MMSHRLRRVFALGAASLLAGAGLVALAATPAFAVGVADEAQLNTAIANGDAVIELTSDITLAADISSITYPVTIDGNDFEIDANGHDGFDIDLDGTETASLSDVTIVETDEGVSAGLADTATLTLTNVTVTSATGAAFLVYAEDESSVFASGLTAADAYYGFYFSSASGADASFSVSDSSFTNNLFGLYFAGYGTSSGTVTDTDMSANDYGGLNTDMLEDGMDLVVSRSTMNDNDRRGVSLTDMSGTLLIEDSTVDGNSQGGIVGVGDIYSDDGGQFTLSGSTVSNNTAGGIELNVSAEDATFTMINSTVSGNDGNDYGWPAVSIYGDDYDGAGVFIYNSTITANTAVRGGIRARDAPAEISHSIISGNEVGVYADVYDDASDYDISWSIVDIDDPEGSGAGAAFTEGDGVVFSTEPGLGALADNGGPTLTHLPLDGSLALNAGNPDAEAGAMGVPGTDQRGLARVSGTAIDIGAVEVQEAAGAQEAAELAPTGVEAGIGVAGGLTLLTLGLGLVGIRIARRRQLA